MLYILTERDFQKYLFNSITTSHEMNQISQCVIVIFTM